MGIPFSPFLTQMAHPNPSVCYSLPCLTTQAWVWKSLEVKTLMLHRLKIDPTNWQGIPEVWPPWGVANTEAECRRLCRTSTRFMAPWEAGMQSDFFSRSQNLQGAWHRMDTWNPSQTAHFNLWLGCRFVSKIHVVVLSHNILRSLWCCDR